jgi:hypothetical protein
MVSRFGLAALVVAATAGLGCGTVCDDAVDVCGFEESSQPEDCSGATECASLCIVDWDSCNVNDAESAVAKCIARCLEQAEGS